MELRQVRYFLSVSLSLNFTRAAQYCNVTQPALTKAIQKLEAELGRELIHRERQLTQLTDLGKLVLPMLQILIAAADGVRLHAREFQRKEIAPLKLGLTPCISAKLIVRPLSEIARLMPGLQVEMIEEPLDRLVDMLFDGDVNVALTGETGILPDRIDHWRLFEERLMVILSVNDPRAKGHYFPIDDMQETAWLERVGCEVVRELWKVLFPQREAKIVHRGHQEGHLHHMVAAGLGAMIAAEHAPRPPSLVALPIEKDRIRRQVNMLAVAGRRYSPALDAFIKIGRVYDWKCETAPASPRDPAGNQETKACNLNSRTRTLSRVDGG